MTGKVAFEMDLEAQVEFPKQKKMARRHNPFGEMFGRCLIKLIIHVANEPAICVCVCARVYVVCVFTYTQNECLCPLKDTYTNIQSSFIHNSQSPDSAQTSNGSRVEIRKLRTKHTTE